MFGLQDKVAIVTGGAQGIGKGIAVRLLKEGMRVVIADIDREAGEEAIGELRMVGEGRFFCVDVKEERAVEECVRSTIEAFGRLDALINNAGIANALSGPLEQLTLDEWNRTTATNLTGYFLFAKHSIPHLRKCTGSILNIASTRAFQSEPDTEAYAASKGGVVGLTHALAVSLGPSVRVNCISPGWIDVSSWRKDGERPEYELRPIDHTQHPVGRVGRPEDVASLTAFLISDEAGFITGQNFIVDGGMVRKMIYVE